MTVNETIITEIAKAGVLFLVMGIAIYFLYSENRIFRDEMRSEIDTLKKDYKQCVEDNIDILTRQNEILVKYIEDSE